MKPPLPTTHRVNSGLLTILLLVNILSQTLSVRIYGITSQPKPGCVAELSTEVGQKWVNLEDDLHLVGDGQYRYTSEESPKSYLWRPCKQFDISLPESVPPSDNTCQNTYVAWKLRDRDCTCLGHDAAFNVVDGELRIDYTLKDMQYMNATVKLVCNETLTRGLLTCEDHCLSYKPVLKYQSKYVCLRKTPGRKIPIIKDAEHLSAGSYTLIAASIIFSVYIITGLIRGCIKGRSGCDRLPNSDFWLELPLLVKDGCCFVCCCRFPFVYIKRHRKGEIYEPIVYDKTTPVVDL